MGIFWKLSQARTRSNSTILGIVSTGEQIGEKLNNF
jgi:hypothetical protein